MGAVQPHGDPVELSRANGTKTAIPWSARRQMLSRSPRSFRRPMGQEESKPHLASDRNTSEPVPPSAAKAGGSVSVEAELARMLRVSTVGDAPPPAYALRARDLAARGKSLPPPRKPIVASSIDSYLINRHDRTVEEINRKTPIFQPRAQFHQDHAAIPSRTDVHRALAALQTHDMEAAQDAVGNAAKISENLKLTVFQTQLAKSIAMQSAHEVHRLAVSLSAECDALSLAIHGTAARPSMDPSGSPWRPTSESNVSPAVPQRHVGLIHAVAEIAAIARQVDGMLCREDREAIRDAVAVMPATPSLGSGASQVLVSSVAEACAETLPTTATGAS